MLLANYHSTQTLGKYKVNFTGREELAGYQLLPIFLTFNFLLRNNLPSIERLITIPWWFWIGGGVSGAFVVTAALTIQPKIGAGRWISCYLCGQLLMSMLLDHFGWMSLEIYAY